MLYEFLKLCVRIFALISLHNFVIGFYELSFGGGYFTRSVVPKLILGKIKAEMIKSILDFNNVFQISRFA